MAALTGKLCGLQARSSQPPQECGNGRLRQQPGVVRRSVGCRETAVLTLSVCTTPGPGGAENPSTARRPGRPDRCFPLPVLWACATGKSGAAEVEVLKAAAACCRIHLLLSSRLPPVPCGKAASCFSAARAHTMTE